MTVDEQHSIGLKLVIICLLACMVALAAIARHPEWFNPPAATSEPQKGR